MSDRELLEQAALAAGVAGTWATGHQAYGDLHFEGLDCGWRFLWNPLVSDGDAFRLAVKLGLKVEHHDDSVVVWDDYCGTGFIPYDGDPCKATRRAIVLSASEHDRATAQGAGDQSSDAGAALRVLPAQPTRGSP